MGGRHPWLAAAIQAWSARLSRPCASVAQRRSGSCACSCGRGPRQSDREPRSLELADRIPHIPRRKPAPDVQDASAIRLPARQAVLHRRADSPPQTADTRRVPHTGRSRLSGPAGRHWQEWKVRIRLDRECLSSRSQRLDLNGTYHCGHRYYSDGYRQPLDLKGTYHSYHCNHREMRLYARDPTRNFRQKMSLNHIVHDRLRRRSLVLAGQNGQSGYYPDSSRASLWPKVGIEWPLGGHLSTLHGMRIAL